MITTTERNFQRSVEVQVKRGTGDWERWAQGTIFSFDTATMHESQLAIDMPEVATGEFRLVFKNLDSPPLSVTGMNGEGYRRLLIFKQQAGPETVSLLGQSVGATTPVRSCRNYCKTKAGRVANGPFHSVPAKHQICW